jgi:hypothetical protein
VAYRWYHPTATARTFEDAAWVTVDALDVVNIDICASGFTGGTFKGTVSSSQPGFDPECVSVMAFEGTSGVLIGRLSPARSDGKYRHLSDLPPGDYRALAVVGTAVGCPDPVEVLDQWRGGGSGGGLLSTSAPSRLFDTAKPFSITAGSVTGGIHFDLIPVGTCGGEVPTILGTTEDDVIMGTDGPDVIRLFDGDDEAYGEGGKDVICGDQGNDLLEGGALRDKLYGAGGRDQLEGGGGNDYIHGAGGVDELFGGPGNDKLVGGRSHDLIYGNGGRDTLRGNRGTDTMYGGADDDFIDGGPGPGDSGDGGSGSDTCTAATETAVSC